MPWFHPPQPPFRQTSISLDLPPFYGRELPSIIYKSFFYSYYAYFLFFSTFTFACHCIVFIFMLCLSSFTSSFILYGLLNSMLQYFLLIRVNLYFFLGYKRELNRTFNKD